MPRHDNVYCRCIPLRLFLLAGESVLLVFLFPHQRAVLWWLLILALIVSFLLGRCLSKESYLAAQKSMKGYLSLLAACAAIVLVLEGNGFIEALRFRALENQYRSAASQAVAAAQMLPDQTYAKLENTAAAHSLALKGTLFYHKTLEEIDIYFQIEETFFQSSGFLYVQSTPPGKKDLSLSYDEIHWIADDWAYVKLY